MAYKSGGKGVRKPGEWEMFSQDLFIVIGWLESEKWTSIVFAKVERVAVGAEGIVLGVPKACNLKALGTVTKPYKKAQLYLTPTVTMYTLPAPSSFSPLHAFYAISETHTGCGEGS